MVTSPNKSFLKFHKSHHFPGFVYGVRQPCVLIELALGDTEINLPNRLSLLWLSEKYWQKALNQPRLSISWQQEIDQLTKLAKWVQHWTFHIQRAANIPTFEIGKIISAESTGDAVKSVRFLIPTPENGVASSELAFDAVVKCTAYILDTIAPHENTSASASNRIASIDFATLLSPAVERLKHYAPKGANTPRFLNAAFELGIPTIHLGNDTYQFGYCSKSRWLESTFTDKTANISARMARNKAWAANILKMAGLPAPGHQLVADSATAIQLATKIGFPVVIKPADLDGGQGVTAGIINESSLKNAFDKARKLSDKVLLEKHFNGRDYRLTVFNGRLIWSVERVPAGVTGDGIRTIQQLINLENADDRRGSSQHAALKKIHVDSQTVDILNQQGLQFNSIPTAGQFVPLTRTANVATGGMPIAVNELVHPDNADLAIRAAAALRLDLAGVDLLIPDISVSWLQSGAAICEVNAQPQIGAITAPHLYGEILKEMLPNHGRVPIIVVVDFSPESELTHILEETLTDMPQQIGIWHDALLQTQVAQSSRPMPSAFLGGRALLLDPGIDLILFKINSSKIMQTGLPFDGFDALVLADMGNISADNQDKRPPEVAANSLLESLFCSCKGPIFKAAAAHLADIAIGGLDPPKVIDLPAAPVAALKAILAKIPLLENERFM
jgi:cyanophycin synthetase